MWWLLGRRGYFSTICGDDLPIYCTPNVPLEQSGVGPLLGNNVPQLLHFVFLGLDAESDRVEPVSEFLEHAGSTPIRDLQKFE